MLTASFRIALLPILAFFLSCNGNSNSEKEVITALEKNLENASFSFSASTNTLLSSLETNLSDPATHARAKVWEPKARQIHAYAEECYSLIELFKKNENANREEVFKLFKILFENKARIRSIDPKISEAFANATVIYNEVDSNFSKEKFFEIFFKKSSQKSISAFLTSLQFNIRTLENNAIRFCYEQLNKYVLLYDTYSPIIGQSSATVEPGKQMEISAGLAAFNKAALPHIMIDNKDIAINELGKAIYKFTAPNQTGKHAVKVKIEFIDQNGTMQVLESIVQYTVAKICNE